MSRYYNDKKAKLNELPIKTNLLGEYIIELNGRLYTTIVYDDPPLAEFQTYRKVNYISDVSEADITTLNILTVKDTSGLNVIQLITKNIYVVAEKDSANILGIIKGEIGVKYTGVESEKTQIFAVGETVNYDVQNKFERWVYRAAGLKDQTTLSPITKFNSPAKYKVSYETYDGVRLSTNYKNSIGFGSKEIQTGINIPNLPNPTIPSTQFTIQETPEWFRAVSITETDKTLGVNGRLVLINLEADEWLIVNKDGEIDNTVGQIDRDMIMTVYRTGEFEAYLLYRQGSIVRRAKLIRPVLKPQFIIENAGN